MSLLIMPMQVLSKRGLQSSTISSTQRQLTCRKLKPRLELMCMVPSTLLSLASFTGLCGIVDHLHFQCNGFLLGILLVSFSCLEGGREGRDGWACFFCVVVLQAFVYGHGTSFFGYLLRHYCWKGLVRRFWRLSILGTVFVAVFALAYGSFVYHGQGTLPCLLGGHKIFGCSISYQIRCLHSFLEYLDSTFRHQQLHLLVG